MTDKIAALQEEIETLRGRIETLEQHIESDEIPEDESTFDVVSFDEEFSEWEARPHPKQVIADACEHREDGVSAPDARTALRDAGYDDPDDEIEQLLRRGEIYKPRYALLRVV